MKTKNEKNNELVERDLSWMYFNHRILQEAQREEVPLLERLNFLGIYSNNLDEFFRVRVATLSKIAESKEDSLKDEAKNAKKTIEEINVLNSEFSKEFAQSVKTIIEKLKNENIFLIDEKSLTEEQAAYLKEYYYSQLYGSIFPIWIDKISDIQNEEDDAIYLAVKLSYKEEGKKSIKKEFALIKVPASRFGRFLRLPDKDGKSYLMYLDDVIRYCLKFMFAGLPFTEYDAYEFKFTKDAEMELDSELESGKIQKIKKGLKSRKQGNAMRIIVDENMPKDLYKAIMSKLNVDKLDTVLKNGKYHNHKDFMKFPDCGRKDLKFQKWEPLRHRDFVKEESLFESIKSKDLFLHVPYYNFDGYLRFLYEAAVNPKVTEIKTTLYRLAKDSKVIESLIASAKNGKKVTVIIELLARFDEANNVKWSEKMQEAGIKVLFGVEGLKVHSKITLVKMQDADYAAIGTGNFHEGNAKVYTDCILFTAKKSITKDIEKVFEFIQTPYIKPTFKELLVSPNDMKNNLLKMIDKETENAEKGISASIKMKINHITDIDMIKHLNKAAESGVDIKIVLRGNCSLKNPKIEIHGIIDRYLEHSRILIFENGGQPLYFMGSADWMPRNLESRVEVMTPIYNADIQRELKRIVEYGLKDTSQGRIVDGTGNNELYSPAEGENRFRSQEQLYLDYKQENLA